METTMGCAILVFLITFCIVGLPTNQVHQWAHMSRPPQFVRMLQTRGLVLSRGEHLKHHREPYARNYCIATGWCNRPLEAISFFRRCERLVTVVTGLEPRADDAEFAANAILKTVPPVPVECDVVFDGTAPPEGALP
jgi:ubiquitin-conjugating enzyme E2 variant